MDIRKILVSLALVCFFSVDIFAQTAAEDKILGLYEVTGEVTGETARVEFYKQGDGYEGRIAWLENPSNPDGSPRLDADNPDPELRLRPACGITIVWGLRYDADAKTWTGGRIYNPVGGKTYNVNIELEEPGTLKVRGYMGRPMLGKTYYWKKLK